MKLRTLQIQNDMYLQLGLILQEITLSEIIQ